MAARAKLEGNHSREHPLASEEWLASYILGCIADPRAVCRLALVNKTFCAASTSDSVWQKLLPPVTILNPLLAHVDYRPPSKKHLCMYLCKSITYDQEMKKFWLDPSTGGECHMISARALCITWGDTPQHWQWNPRPGSMFSEVACLCGAFGFEVTGTFKNVVRPGRYIISFRMQLHSTRGWQAIPVKFRVQNNTFDSEMFFDGSAFKIRTCPSSSIKQCQRSSGFKQVTPRFFKSIKSQLGGYPIADGIEEANETCELEESDIPKLVSSSKDPHKWVECDVGEFFVEDGNENHPIEVHFSMREINIGWWLLILDGAIVRPSYVIDKIHNDKKKTLLV